MSLSSLQLDAFQAVAQEKNFSRAAERLHVTQSALSQRVQKLEAELGVTLFKRASGGVELTEAGLRLQQYCQIKENLEQEALQDLFGKEEAGLGGMVRIGAYSSVARSVLQPALAGLLREHPGVQMELCLREMGELPNLLFRGDVDFLVLDHVLDRAGVESYVLGHETYVMVESSKYDTRHDIYLDQAPEDLYTQAFLRRQGERLANVRRSFLHDAYGILEGAQQGLGRAIVPRHLLKGVGGLRVVDSWQEQKVPVVLHFYQQPYYTALMQAVTDELLKKAPAQLA